MVKVKFDRKLKEYVIIDSNNDVVAFSQNYIEAEKKKMEQIEREIKYNSLHRIIEKID